MAIPDWELWACANEAVRQNSADAGIFAAQRADELPLKGDIDGAATWQAIIRRIKQLQRCRGSLLQYGLERAPAPHTALSAQGLRNWRRMG